MIEGVSEGTLRGATPAKMIKKGEEGSGSRALVIEQDRVPGKPSMDVSAMAQLVRS